MRFLPLLLLAGCLDFSEERRRDDPFDRYDRMPVGAGNIKVIVEQFEFDATETAAFDAAFAYRDNTLAVAGGAIYGPNGATVFAGTRNFVAAFRAETKKYRSQRYTKSFQVVADGHEAQLQVVDLMTASTTYVIPVYRGTVIVKEYHVIPVGTMLAVKPTKRGALVDLEVTPVFSQARGGTIQIVELTTRLTVEVGRPTVIMAHEETQDSFGAAFFSKRVGTSTRKIVQVVTVEAP